MTTVAYKPLATVDDNTTKKQSGGRTYKAAVVFFFVIISLAGLYNTGEYRNMVPINGKRAQSSNIVISDFENYILYHILYSKATLQVQC